MVWVALTLPFAPFLHAQGYDLVLNNAPVQIYFSPNGGATGAIIRVLDGARQSIYIQEYQLTSKVLTQAIVAAHRRGVKVIAILDKTQATERYSSAAFLSRAGIEVFIDAEPKIAHSKIAIVDGSTVLGGSLNWSNAAENSNVENLIIIKDQGLARIYQKDWEARFNRSVRYQPQ
jgi:phosphatidylserine/phosphatidylglycerophosphate/cardiolipin synthase-like enzyme